MGLTVCPLCKGKVSETASVCPHCGHQRGGDTPSTTYVIVAGEMAPPERRGCKTGCSGCLLWVVVAGVGYLIYHLFSGTTPPTRPEPAPTPAPVFIPPSPPSAEMLRRKAEAEAEAEAKADEEKRKEEAEVPARRRAETLLKAGRNLDRAGKTKGALEFYRRVLKEHPATKQAEQAAARVKALDAPP